MPKEILKNSFKIQNPEKGVLLYYAVVITSLLLAIALGLGTIFITQIKGLKEMGDSAIAFFAADTGIEKILYLDKDCSRANCTTTIPFGPLCQEQMNLASTTNCIGLYYYSTSTTLSNGSEYFATASSTGEGILLKSKGIYKGTQRGIEVTR